MRPLITLSIFCLSTLCAAEVQPPTTLEAANAQRARANILRKEVDQSRKAHEKERDEGLSACMNDILVNYCKEKTRETYISKMTAVRAKEQEAHELDKAAKTFELRLKEAKLNASAQSAPASNASAPAVSTSKKPTAAPIKTQTPQKIAPPPTPSQSSLISAQQLLREKEAAAEKRKQENISDAAQRKQKAKEDAARYAARAKEHAEKKAKKQNIQP